MQDELCECGVACRVQYLAFLSLKKNVASVLASGSPWPTCVQQGALLLSSPVGSFLVPGLDLSPQTSELHSAKLLRRCFGCLTQTQTTSRVQHGNYVRVDVILQILSLNRKRIAKAQRMLV